MNTKKQILADVQRVANFYNAKVIWGSEDGITWLTLYDGSINPKIFDEVTAKMSQETGVDCYFNKCGIESIEIAFNAKMRDGYNDDDVPGVYEQKHIDTYGTLFK